MKKKMIKVARDFMGSLKILAESVKDYAKNRKAGQGDEIVENNHVKYWQIDINKLMGDTIKEFFNELSSDELEYFRDFLIDELDKNRVVLSQVSDLIYLEHVESKTWNAVKEIEMHCEISQAFAFFYNKMRSIPSTENGFKAIMLFLSQPNLNEMFLDGYDYETKKRFAEELEVELPNKDGPRHKRTKI